MKASATSLIRSSSVEGSSSLRASAFAGIAALAIGTTAGGWYSLHARADNGATVDPTFEQAVVPASPEDAALPTDEARPAPATPTAPPNSRRDEFDDGSEAIWPGQIAG
jgi:hypothetical protein